MHLAKPLLESALAAPHAGLPGIVHAVGEPERKRVRADFLRDRDRLAQVVDRAAADCGVLARERAAAVALVLKDVGVDRADPKAPRLGGRGERASPLDDRVAAAPRDIPQDVDRDRRAASGQAMDLGRVIKLVLGRERRGVLEELPEAGAGVGEAPGRQLDLKGPKPREGAISTSRMDLESRGVS